MDDKRVQSAGAIRMLCATAVRTAHVDGAAVGLLAPGCTARELLCATDPLVARIDDIQITLGEGPCLDAYRRRTPQLRSAIGNQHAESPWPLFDDAVHEIGVRAVFAYPLLRKGATPVGVLAMYRRTEGPLDGGEQAAATLSTVIAMDGPQNMVSPAPSSPHTQVPVAAGMIALQLNLLIDEALDVLRAYSFSHDRPLAAIADDVVQRRTSFAGGWPTS
jgi:hypothetical protein